LRARGEEQEEEEEEGGDEGRVTMAEEGVRGRSLYSDRVEDGRRRWMYALPGGREEVRSFRSASRRPVL